MADTTLPALDRAAACDHHLNHYLGLIVRLDTRAKLRVSNMSRPDGLRICGCGVPAKWYVYLIETETD